MLDLHATSGYPLQQRNATDEELLREGHGYTDPTDSTVKYYDDPFSNYTNVTDFVINSTMRSVFLTAADYSLFCF